MLDRKWLHGAVSVAWLIVVVAWRSPAAHAAERTAIATDDPAAYAKLHARIFTDDDGLPQNAIEALSFDLTGRLWATTREGGAHFDGSGWTSLAMPNTAWSNWPRTTLASSDGAVWFGTEGGGLHRYRDGVWSSVAETRIESETVVSLAETSNAVGVRTIWAGSHAGLFRIDADSLQASAVQELAGKRVTALLASSSQIVAGTEHGELFRCSASRCDPDVAASALLAGARIGGFAEQSGAQGTHALWIATDRGIGVVSDEGSTVELAGKRVNAVALTRDARGTITPWAALEGGGLRFRLDGRWLSPALLPGLPDQFVFGLAPYPASGETRHLFAGTLNGLVRIDLGSWRSIDVSAGLPDASVVSILESRAGGRREHFLGTTGGLATFHDGAWRPIDSDLVARAPVFSLLESADGTTIWAGTNAGLVRRSAGRWSVEGAESGLPRESVVSLLETREHEGTRLWAGTYGAGLWSRDQLGRWSRTEGLPDGRIEALVAENNGGGSRVWAATNRGLVRIEGDRIDIIDRERGLPADIVRSLHTSRGPDGRNYLWVGTAGGLAWREAGTVGTKWESLSRSRGAALPSDTIYQVQSEGANRLWLFTGRGVVRLTFPAGATPTASNASLQTFTTADGLPGNECNFGASMIDSAGRIWAGTTRGAALFDPASSTDDRVPKTLVVLESRAGRGAIDIAKRRVLRHDENDVAFAFRIVDPGRGDDAEYRTQLAGREQEPGDWTRSAERSFTGLAAGHYTFRVWGRDSRGNVSGPKEVGFRVVAPTWRTWWAILAYLAAGIVALSAIHRFRMRSISARAEKLEKVVRSRTRDLERMNRELEAANATLADMSVTDPLTGAKNRRFLGQEMERESGRIGRSMRSGDDLMFFIVDIDLFKSVNDRFGHTVGDAILRQFCGTLASAVRETDTIVRWGGEEFLVVARRSSRAEAPRIADRILETVRAEVFDAFDGRLIQLTCSIGWAVFPFLPTDADVFAWDEVVDIADHCLLAAKASGRDAWVGLGAGPGFRTDTFFPRLRTSASAMAAGGELVISTSLDDPAAVRWL